MFQNALNYKELRFYYAPVVELKPEERHLKPGNIIRRKSEMFIIAEEGCYLTEVEPDKDWFETTNTRDKGTGLLPIKA